MKFLRERPIYKAEQMAKGSYALGCIWTFTLIATTIFIGITARFEFWWILIIISLLSFIMLIWHWIITYQIIEDIAREENMRKLKWMWALQLVTFNIPLVAYEVIGLVFYRKAFSLL